MSVAEVAVHGGRGRRRTDASTVGEVERPVVRLMTFSALALYGVMRWATLESPAPGARLAGLLVLAIVVAGAGPWLSGRSRPLALVALVLSVMTMLALAGIPVAWIIHARVAVIWQGIGHGLTALPNSVVPYDGIDPWLRVVIPLGAGVLLLDAAAMVALGPRRLGDLRRAAVALPLIALAIVPATLVRPQLPYLQGMFLFTLVAAFFWGDRVAPRRSLGAFGVAAAAGVGGMVIGPALEQHHAWVNPEGIAGSFTPVQTDRFDWTQRYGPFSWPRDNRDVLDVRAARPDYWKAENLDAFNGVGWAQAQAGLPVSFVAPAELRRFSQTITVTIRDMSTVDVIGAGSAYAPPTLDQPVLRGASPGTWTVDRPLRIGDSYTVDTYSPHPTPAQLRSDRGGYPAEALADGLTIALPRRRVRFGGLDKVQFPQFHSRAAPATIIGPPGVGARTLVEDSPYAHSYALATRLASGARTPYDFAVAIERYLSPGNGFVYDERPPASTFPLASFLFSSKHGYCQQFAGAMALLLRMGGVPARVVTGFTTGAYDAANHSYVVSDLDAHAWVEAWFPSYGWVRFDPTPASAPARTGGGVLPALRGGSGANRAHPRTRRDLTGTATRVPAAGNHRSGGGVPLAALIVGLVALMTAAALLGRALMRPAPTAQQLVTELERAMARAGRPLQRAVTLRALEERFHASPAAVTYVRALRLARFGGNPELPNTAERRALRGQLARGLGLRGKLRAWWALPPRGLH